MPRRADAQRNYELLLAAARDAFDEHGADAPLDEIARRAGVGNATLYRHFPTRRDLLVAVFAEEVAHLCSRGEALLAEDSADDALFAWLRIFIDHVATKRDLAFALNDAPTAAHSTLLAQWHQAMHTTATALLARAQQAGSARPGLDAMDLLAVANGIALTGTTPTQLDRLLALIRHGATP
jgi:AcrR family transcriptional regulator